MNQCNELQDIDLPSFSLGFEEFQPPSFSLGIDDSQQTANPNAWQTSDAEDHGWVNVCKGPKLQKDAGKCAQGIVGKREADHGVAAASGDDDDDFELFRGEIPRRSFKRLRRVGSAPKKGCKSSSPAPVFNVDDPIECSMKNGDIQILSPAKESDVFVDDIEDFSSEGEPLESSTHVPRSYLSLRPSKTPPTFGKSSSTVGINAAFASTSKPSVSVKKNSLGSKEVKLDNRTDQQDFGAMGTKTGFSSFSSPNMNGGSGSSTCTMRPSFSKIHSESFYGDLPKNWNSTSDSRWRDTAGYGEALQQLVGDDSLNNFATYTPGTRKCSVGANNTWTPPSTITAKNDCLQVTSSKIFANSSNSKGKSCMEIHTPSLGGEKIIIDDNDDDDDADIQVAASGYKTVCQDEEQIDALLKARFPHFTFVDSLQSMRVSDPVYIDYRGQFAGKESTSQKCIGTPKQKNDRSWSRVRKAVPKPRAQKKVTGSQAQIGDTAGFSGRKGHWLTDNGRKVYVAQDGQRLTGRAAYLRHVKDSGRQKRKNKKQKVRKK